MKWLLYVGGFGKSIEMFEMILDEKDIKKTSITYRKSLSVEDKPAYIKMRNDIMYCIHEVNSFNEMGIGCTTAHKIEDDGSLTNIQTRASLGLWPCHITFNERRKIVYIPSYFTGHFEIATVEENGHFGECVFKHHFPKSVGSCVDPDGNGRQMQSHPHGAYLRNDHVYIPDLGADKIWHFRHGEGLDFTPANSIVAPPGSAPRHLVFHPKYDLVFVIGELSCVIIVYRFHKESGDFEKLAVYDYLYPHQKEVRNYGAEIDLHNSGNFLYISNRGHGSIISYRVLDSDGKLEPIECFKTLGTWPRAFVFDPTGKMILCGDQFDDVIEIIAIDENNGKLERVCEIESKNKPSSFVFKEME